MQENLTVWCRRQGREELLCQWHPQKNAGLTPADISHGSHKKIWWRCEKGHEWQAELKSRSRGDGCPFCANRRLKPAENALAGTHPVLAAQWHPTRNGERSPRDYAAGSKIKVWWRCEKGHEWQAAIQSRACRGSGCPVCSGKTVVPGENDLASFHPGLAAQWHPVKNAPLTAADVTAYSNRRVWWQCAEGHEWQAAISARCRESTGCPVCSGRQVLAGFNDLATRYPKIAAQWDGELNGALTPEMVTAGSSKRVWWRCGDGHVWKAVISSRTGKRKHGCPVCAGRVKRIAYPRPERYAG